jgi:23S rRNA (uracil1939-C5)-methyltransferase
VTPGEPIVRVAARGDGVTASGRHIPLSAPGDTVAPDGIVTPGPHHAAAPCRHFPECGGCQLQHLDDEAYSGFLGDRIATALDAQRLAVPELLPAHLSSPHTRRRASLSAERRGNRLLLGFKSEGSHRIVDMRECFVLRPELFALVQPLRDLLGALLKEKRGVAVRMTIADQGIDLLLANLAWSGLEATELLTGFAREQRLARLAVNDGLGPQILWEPEPVTVGLGGVPVPMPPDSFLQATEEGERALVAGVRAAVGAADTIADLFAGLGTFALSLDGRVLAVEASRDAILSLKAASQRAQRSVAVEHRDLYRRPLDASELERFAAVVLDPPRAGAKEQCTALAGSSVPRIAYVSCNPVTFARDARLLIDSRYRLAWIQPVGQFRWSTHVELVGAFERQ